MSRRIPAAAVPVGARVNLLDGEPSSGFTIEMIENGTPEPGRITWHASTEEDVEIGASTMVEVVSLP